MGQYHIIELLENTKRWLTAKDLANLLGVGYSCTRVKLKKLRNRNEVNFFMKNRVYYYHGKVRNKR